MRLHDPLLSVWAVLMGPVLITCTLLKEKTPNRACADLPLLFCTIADGFGTVKEGENQKRQDQTA
ncbi:unnamed protein product, partial [Staurois parvus]